MSQQFMSHRLTTAAAALALAAAFGLTALAQTTGQAGQGRAGGAAGGQTAGRGGQTQTTQGQVRDTQAQTQQGQQQPANTGVISGVVSSDGGSPLRRVRVSLTAPELRGGRTTITSDQGGFTFTALPAGRYTVTASKPSYIDMPYGAKKAGRPGTPIQLAAASKMDHANIILPKGGVLSGVVVDDAGEPSPRTQVRAMRYVIRTGEKTLQSAGTAQTDDRGMYRIFGLQPGDYLVSAVPANAGLDGIRQTMMAEMESLLQQAQGGALGAALGGRGGGGGGGRGGAMGIDLQQLMGRGGNPQQAGRLQQLQDQLAQADQTQNVVYAPVYFPGTATPSTAAPVTLAVAEERNGVDFRLVLVPTAKIVGSVTSTDGLPQGTQLTLLPLDQGELPSVPGVDTDQTRVGPDGTFTFRDIPPGQYRVMARGAVRDPNAAAQGRGGRGGGAPGAPGGQGGPGGRGGGILQVLWGSADVNVNGQDVNGVSIALQEGMTITGRIAFDSGIAPTDLSTVRINLTPRGSQSNATDFGPTPPPTVDASGHFTIKGVLPGKYSLSANMNGGGGFGGGGGGGAAAGGGGARGGGGGGRGAGGGGAATTTTTTSSTTQFVLKSVVANGRDALDFGLVIEPNQDVSATVTFTDKTQEVSGTIQDTLGNPTADYTIVLFAADKSFWVPQARRIVTSRPGTDGKFTFRNLPTGDYRLTAVTDVEPGEWFDPSFLGQLLTASIPVTVKDGEKKVQDIKVQGGGH